MGRPRKHDRPLNEERAPVQRQRLLTLAQAQRKYQLHPMHVYAACRRGEMDAFELEGRTSTYYPESQLRRLATEIGLYSDRAA